LNTKILESAAQEFINGHLNDDVHKISMSKSPIEGIAAKELANQIAAKKKSLKKLPTWFQTTALYKANLAIGNTLIDLTAGFGVDSYYFSQRIQNTVHCEIDTDLLEISKHNAEKLGQHNTDFINQDGLTFLKESDRIFDTIYIDPVRRGATGKVFMLKDCSPNVVENLDLLLAKSKRLIIKTAPMLDITAGLNELRNVSEVHIVSVHNEVKELLWILEKDVNTAVEITAVTINEQLKTFSFTKNEEHEQQLLETESQEYLYEPDTALLKSGAFNLIAKRYQLQKLSAQTHLYTSAEINTEFPGRIFKIIRTLSPGDLKKEKDLKGNVITRNYRDTPENLIKKYRIKSDDKRFLVFTEMNKKGFVVIDANIIQYY
jgi:16S rRNA G966 N2-methylase RsmD